MSRYAVYIDSFSGALGDLPRKLHRDINAVLACLREHPRFCTWDADASPAMARTMTFLFRAGYIREVEPRAPYPWHHVEVVRPPGQEQNA